jgi:WD40 repeat protein
MSWPLPQDYNEAIQDPTTSFADPELRGGEPATNALGLPLPRSGNFADVYEFRCPASNTKWAVKCFTRQVAGQRERYSEVSRHLQAARLPFAVDFQYLEQGIRVRGQWYPILKMRWVEGLLLNEFVRDNLDKPALLQALSQIWLRMAKRLREAKVAHADLQHGNVLLVPGSTASSLAVKLIDYDGMWVPTLAGKNSGEVGHPNYQHPQRLREGTYNPEVDRFPELVVATALRALALGGKALWQRYDNGDNLLFKEADLRAPASSALFGELGGMADPLLQQLVGKLQASVQAKLEQTPLLEEVLPEEKTAIKGKAATAMASGPDWDFSGGVEQPVLAPRRRRRSGVPGWAWAASAAALVLLLGGVYFATRGGNDDGKQKQVAQNPTRPTQETRRSPRPPTTRPGKRENPRDPVRPPDNPPVAVAGTWPPPLFLVLSQSNDLVAVSDGDAGWRLYSTHQRKPLQTFAGHEGRVNCLGATPDHKRVLTGSEDLTLRLWDAESGKALAVLRAHRHPVVAVALSADGKQALSADLENTALLWDVDAEKVVRELSLPRGVSAVAFSPDGKQVACGTRGNDGKPNPVFVLDADTGTVVQEFQGHPSRVSCVAFAPGGKRLASAGLDGALRFWEVGKQLESGSFSGIQGPARRLVFAPDGSKVLVDAGSQCFVVSAKTRRLLGSFGRPNGDDTVSGVFDNNGAQLAVAIGKRDGTFIPAGSTIGQDRGTPVAGNPPRQPRDFRQPVPEGEALAAGAKERDALLRDKTGARNENLWGIAVGGGNHSQAARYVALKECMESAAEKGDLRLALFRADIMAQRYTINLLEVKAGLVEQAARSGQQSQYVAEQALKLVLQAQAAEDYDLAVRLLKAAEDTAAKAGKPSLAAEADRMNAAVTAAKAEYPAVKPALESLASDPKDAEANLKVGRFRCLYQDNWEEGLVLLARGSDESLKTLAARDLAGPAEAEARREVGDGWWTLGEKEKGPAQHALQCRAYDWYKQALPGLAGGQAKGVQKRMDAIATKVPDVLDPWRHLDATEGIGRGESIHLDPGRCLFTRRWYKGGIDITVVARTTKNNIRLTAGAGARVIFNHEGTWPAMEFNRPDNPTCDGRGGGSGSVAKTNPKTLTTDEWHTLRWLLTPTGTKVWADGELVLQAEEGYDLSTVRPVGVCSTDSPLDVKSVVVKPVPATPKDKP